MDLWTDLANLAPNPYLPAVAGVGFAALMAVIVWSFVWKPGEAATVPTVMAITIGIFLGAIGGVGTHLISEYGSERRAGDAIENYLRDTYHIRTTDPIALDFTKRTAETEGRAADGSHVTVDLEWISFDARTDNVLRTRNYHPLTVTVTPH